MQLLRLTPILTALAAWTCFSFSALAENPASGTVEVGTPQAGQVDATATATPEPNTVLLAGLGGLVLWLLVFRRK